MTDEERAAKWLLDPRGTTPQKALDTLASEFRAVREECRAAAQAVADAERNVGEDCRSGHDAYILGAQACVAAIRALSGPGEKVPGAPEGPPSESRAEPEGPSEPAGGADSAPTGTDPTAAAVEEMRARKDAAYTERNRVVSALAHLFPSGITRTDIPGWDPEWHGCVYIDLPVGQVSWHYHDSHAPMFADLPPYTKPWDGHTTEEKYARLAALGGQTPAAAVALEGPPPCPCEAVMWNQWNKVTQCHRCGRVIKGNEQDRAARASKGGSGA